MTASQDQKDVETMLAWVEEQKKKEQALGKAFDYLFAGSAESLTIRPDTRIGPYLIVDVMKSWFIKGYDLSWQLDSMPKPPVTRSISTRGEEW